MDIPRSRTTSRIEVGDDMAAMLMYCFRFSRDREERADFGSIIIYVIVYVTFYKREIEYRMLLTDFCVD